MDPPRFILRDAGIGEVGPLAEVWREGARTVVALRGEQDMSTAASVAEALRGACAVGQGDVVVDLSRLVFMDATIVRVLVDGRDALGLQARDLTLRAPSTFVRRVLGMCGLVGLVEPASATAAGSCVTVDDHGRLHRGESVCL